MIQNFMDANTPQEREKIISCIKSDQELLKFLTDLILSFGQQAREAIKSIRHLVPRWVYYRAFGTETA